MSDAPKKGEPYDAGDEGKVKARKRKLGRNRREQLGDVRFLLTHEQGRRFLWRLMDHAGVYSTCFTGNSQTFFNEGKRDTGLFVLNEIMQADPDAYIAMIKENRTNDDAR